MRELSLEELKSLHGKPVWCHIPSDQPQWGIVNSAIGVILSNDHLLTVSHYGEWKAFDRLGELEQVEARHKELLGIMQRASRIAMEQVEEERVSFKMDANGNLTRVKVDEP